MKRRRLFWAVCVCLSVYCHVGSVQAGLLYAVEESSDALVSIDTDSLVVTSIGSLGVTFEFGGLAYDPNTDTLYMIGGRSNENLYTVDRTTGQASLVGNYGITDLFGLAFDSTNNILYGSQGAGASGFYSINTSTGGATTIATVMSNPIGGLAYDNSTRDELVGAEDGPGKLYSINRSSGEQSLLFDGDSETNGGLAYDADKDLFWDIDWNGNLFSYDPNNNYSVTTVLTGLESHDGLAYVSTVPVPAAVWLFGSGLLGLISIARHMKAA